MKIYTFTNTEHKLQINKHYYNNIEIINSFSDISWKDIFLRKFRITSIPRTKEIKYTSEKLKAFVARLLCLTTSHNLRIKNLDEIFFNPTQENTLYVCGAHGYNIYRLHVPHFHIIETLGKYSQITICSYFIKSLFKKKDRSHGISVFTNPLSVLMLRTYRALHPNKKIVLRFHDVLESSDINLIKNIKKKFPDFALESYSRSDANNQKILFRPNGVNIKYMQTIDENYRTNIAYFSGSTESSKSRCAYRREAIELLSIQLKNIYKNSDYWITKKLAKNSSDYIPYAEYIRNATLSEIYLDLFRVSPNEGFSFRTPEGIALNRKIITNRLTIKDEPFYEKNRVFILGYDELEGLKSFLESKNPEPLHGSVLKYYDSCRWWTPQDPYQDEKSNS